MAAGPQKAGPGGLDCQDRPERDRVDPHVIGRTLELGDTRHQIVGVVPAGFDFPARADMWTPLTVRPFMTQRGARALQAVGRLKAGTTITDVNTRLESQLSRIYCQIFSTGLSSGHFGGSSIMVMLAGMNNLADRCHPA